MCPLTSWLLRIRAGWGAPGAGGQRSEVRGGGCPKQIRGDSSPYRSWRCWGWEGTSGTYPTPRRTREQEVGEVSGALILARSWLCARPCLEASSLLPGAAPAPCACLPCGEGRPGVGGCPQHPKLGLASGGVGFWGMLVAAPFGVAPPRGAAPGTGGVPQGGVAAVPPQPLVL